MEIPTISSVDASGNVVIATTSTTTIDQLTADLAATTTQITQLTGELSDEQAFCVKLQAQIDALTATATSQQALIDAATPLQVVAAEAQGAPAQESAPQ